MKRYLLSSLALVGAGLALACGSDSVEPEVVLLPDPIVATPTETVTPTTADNACGDKTADNACGEKTADDKSTDDATNACTTKPTGAGNRSGTGSRPTSGSTSGGTTKGGRGGSTSGSTKGGRGGSTSGSGSTGGTTKGGR